MGSGAWFGLGGVIVGVLVALVGVIYRNIGQRFDRHEQDDDDRFRELAGVQREHHAENVANIQAIRDGQQRMIGVMLVMATTSGGDKADRMIEQISAMLQVGKS